MKLLLIVAAASCCAASAAATTSGSIRKDVWNHDMSEHGCDDPTDGRRVHIVLDAVAAGVADADLGSVQINGQEGLKLDTSEDADLKYFDWLRAHTNSATGALWISFHTRNTDWVSSLKVHAATTAGKVLFDGSVSAGKVEGGLTLSYVAFRKGGTEAVLHIHNGDDGGAHALSALSLDGKAATLPAVATQPVPAGGHLVVVVPVPGAAKQPNDVWTVTLGGNGLGFGGRVPANERFVVQVWPHSSDCSLPGGNDDNAQELLGYGIDSVYFTGSFDKNCGAKLVDVINKLGGGGGGANASSTAAGAAGAAATMHVVTDHDTAGAVSDAARKAAIDAILLGDEVDGDVDAEHLRKDALDKAYKAMAAAPTVPTYQGSKTTHNVGAFAGIADIQGSDAYNAACAPTMLAAAKKLPFHYPFDYLRNARDNQAPGVFWGYGQLYSDAWSYQADAPELIGQLGQMVLSGSKALMFFQAYHDQFKQHKMGDIAHTIQSVRAVGDVVREGDVAGLAFATDDSDVMIEVIRSPEKVLVAIVNANAKGYSNLLCHTGITSRHWTFSPHTISKLELDLSSAPDVGKLSNWQEAVKGNLESLSDVDVSTDGSKVKLENIKLDDDVPVRFLVADVAGP